MGSSPQHVVQVAVIGARPYGHRSHRKPLQSRQAPQARHCYLRAQQTPLYPSTAHSHPHNPGECRQSGDLPSAYTVMHALPMCDVQCSHY